MGEEKPVNPITRQPVVLQLDGMESVSVRSDIRYGEPLDSALEMDFYYPSHAGQKTRLPVVLFVTGYPDAAFQKALGCRVKDMQAYASWGRLIAASGLVGVTHTCREPAVDAASALEFLKRNAPEFGLDDTWIGIWSCSGNVPTALSLLIDKGDSLRCAALNYGCMFDVEGSTAVADAAKQWSFANPCAGKSVADLPPNLPLLISRAGLDSFAGLNGTIDSFVRQALQRNLPLTLINNPTGPHAFDLFQDTEGSREIIRRILGFLKFHLSG